jgi:hypothetical protein
MQDSIRLRLQRILKNRVGVSQTVSPGLLSLAKSVAVAVPFFVLLGSPLGAQSSPPILAQTMPAAYLLLPDQSVNSQASASQAAPAASSDPQAPSPSPTDTSPPDSSGGQQTKRILGIVPNFQAVSANTNLPPLTLKQKFWLATQGTFDYSSFISVAMQAAIEQTTNTYPEFHQGAAGYGRYYWHTFADAGIENYMTGAIFPSFTHEDPRYYTLYRGGFFRRTGYAISRLWITKNDKGAARFNISEIVGSGVATEISSRYYPRGERQGAGETLERWASQLLNDGVGNVFEEFWPDIHQKLLRGR